MATRGSSSAASASPTAWSPVRRPTWPTISGACSTRSAGAACFERYPLDKAKALLKEDGWQEFVITAKGSHVTIDFNGTRIIDRDDAKFDKDGIIALQIHVWPEPMEVRFKDIEIKEPLRKGGQEPIRKKANEGIRLRRTTRGSCFDLPTDCEHGHQRSHFAFTCLTDLGVACGGWSVVRFAPGSDAQPGRARALPSLQVRRPGEVRTQSLNAPLGP